MQKGHCVVDELDFVSLTSTASLFTKFKAFMAIKS